MPDTIVSSAVLAELRNENPRKDDRQILQFQHQGYVISVGKNSFSNEKIITDHGHPECLWFHAMAARGSHVVLCIHGRPEPSNDVILFTAALALKNSHSLARTVSVSLLRDVFKPEEHMTGVFRSSRSTSIEVEE